MSENPKIVLASASPRRRELLQNININFDTIISNADENISKDLSPDLYVQELALLKAAAVGKQISSNKNTLIIGSDTIVTYNEKILGKPKSKDEAYQMLLELSGNVHEVITGICVLRTDDAKAVCDSVKTKVYFKQLDDNTIWSYIQTGEPMDKAGSYGIQGIGGLLIEKIEGDYSNVVGLPVSKLYDLLKNEFDYNII